MLKKFFALHSNIAWDPIPFPFDKLLVGCGWLYTIKVGPDGNMGCLKLVGYSSDHKSLMATFPFPWSLCVLGPLINCISRTSSFIVISQRRFIWSNH